MTELRNNDFLLEVSKGNIAGHAEVTKFGRNTDIDTTAEDIWDGGGIWVAPTTARIHNIASSSANDTSAGTGARTIRVFGLTSWSTAEVSEDITMNGTTNVPTNNSYVIIHRMRVLTKGATATNAGTITATAVTDATVTAQINPGEGQTQMTIYGIPSTQTAYMYDYYATALKANTTGAVDVSLRFNPEPDVQLTNYLVKHTVGLIMAGTSALTNEFRPPNGFTGPGILKIQAIGSANNNDISAGFNLVLVDN